MVYFGFQGVEFVLDFDTSLGEVVLLVASSASRRPPDLNVGGHPTQFRFNI